VKVVVLDSLFDSLDVEEGVAAERDAVLERWDGTLQGLADADVVAHVRTRIDAGLIAAMPRCRVIARFGTGVDTVDLGAAEKAGIAVVTIRDYCVPELPAHTLALAFSLARRLADTGGQLDLTWQEVAAERPISRYANAAVIGIGSVGRRVATALAALGYDVTAVTRHAQDEVEQEGWRLATLDEALASADLIFLHAALDDSTRGMIDARRLELVKPGAILIDTARLGLIDEHAVAAALDSGRLGGVALDAKLDPASPLRRFAGDRRVLVTPHTGWYSQESAAALRAAAIAKALDTAREREEVRTT
jgi:D-3-phosphoglycerate dehydrogenase